MYEHKNLFVVYAFSRIEQERHGTLKSKQRWDQCVNHLSAIFGPALRALYAARYFNKEVQETVNIMTKEVIRDLIDEVHELDINDDEKQAAVERLNTAQFIIGYPKEVLNLQKIKEFYKDLELDGTEGIVESFVTLNEYNGKINNNPKSNWKKLINTNYRDRIQYSTNDNIVCKLKWSLRCIESKLFILVISPARIQYPVYHPKRSRFFNTATLFQYIAYSMKEGIEMFLRNELKLQIRFITSVNLAYNNYVKWEKSGGKDLHLPGFFLTNRQMFWVVLAHKHYYKFHPHNSKYGNINHNDKFQDFHLRFKSQDIFREAFNCSELTQDEINKL